MTEVLTRRAITLLRSFGYNAVYKTVIDHPPMIVLKEEDEENSGTKRYSGAEELGNSEPHQMV